MGFGATPQLFLVKPTQRKKSTMRRQRSVPASNFALPQERPQAALPTTCTLSRQMGATELLDFRFCLLSPNILFNPSPKQCAGSEASLPVTSRSRRSAPKLLYQPLAHCRAKWARPNCLTSVSVCFPRTSSSIHHQKQTSTASHHAGLFFILLTFPAHPGWSAWAAPGLCPECTPGMPCSPADRHSPSR